MTDTVITDTDLDEDLWEDDLDATDDEDGFEVEDDADADEDDFEDNWAWGKRATSGSRDYVSGLWSGSTWKSGRRTTAESVQALIAAHKVVRSFIDTFATGDKRFDVTFDPKVATAGTDFQTNRISISPAPALDPTLTAEQAGVIMTGMAVHEAAHVRYGKRNVQAVALHYATSPKPQRETSLKLSSTLDDVRVEGAFKADYPGYSHVFAPTRDYVAKASLGEGGKYQPTLSDPTSLAIAAIHYPEWSDWSDPQIAAERDWWLDWAARNANASSPAKHLAAIQEAMAHIPETQEQAQQQGSGEGDGGEGDGDGQPQSGGQGSGKPLPACIGGEDIAEAAMSNGAQMSVSGEKAQQAINEALTAVQLEDGQYGDIRPCSNLDGRIHRHEPANPAAVSAIRNAFMRSRTGTSDIERGQARGRCDSKSLHRIAHNDPRLFHRRIAPSPGKYRVWMLVDRSGSMQGQETFDTIAVAKALATAGRYMPTLRMEVFGWTDANVNRWGKSPTSALNYAFGAYRAWGTGENIERIDDIQKIDEGGTPDAPTLEWAVKAIAQATATTREQPVILMLSDGAGYTIEMKRQVEKAKKMGVRVVSVAIGSLSEKMQSEVYGDGNYITWKGSIVDTARPLATLIARLVSK